MVWVVVSIGCIECGHENPDPVIGVYSSREKAEEGLGVLRAERDEWIAENARRGYAARAWDDGADGFSTSSWQVRIVSVEMDCTKSVQTPSEPKA